MDSETFQIRDAVERYRNNKSNRGVRVRFISGSSSRLNDFVRKPAVKACDMCNKRRRCMQRDKSREIAKLLPHHSLFRNLDSRLQVPDSEITNRYNYRQVPIL